MSYKITPKNYNNSLRNKNKFIGALDRYPPLIELPPFSTGKGGSVIEDTVHYDMG